MTAVAPQRARVLIAADSLPTRIGLRLALEPDVECTEAEDAESAVAKALRDRPDVCVLDLTDPRNGLQAAGEISARVPSAAVIVLTELPHEKEFLAAVRAGVAGYLPQSVDPARLPFVVRAVMRGEAAVPRRFVSRLIEELRGRQNRRHLILPSDRRVELTSREWEVLELVGQRLATRDIAEQLGITQVTVRRHLGTIKQKLGVQSRAALLELVG